MPANFARACLLPKIPYLGSSASASTISYSDASPVKSHKPQKKQLEQKMRRVPSVPAPRMNAKEALMAAYQQKLANPYDEAEEIKRRAPDSNFFERAKNELARHTKDLEAIEGELLESSWDLATCSEQLEACASKWHKCDDALVDRVDKFEHFRHDLHDMKHIQDDTDKAIYHAVRQSCRDWHQGQALMRSASTLMPPTNSERLGSSASQRLGTPSSRHPGAGAGTQSLDVKHFRRAPSATTLSPADHVLTRSRSGRLTSSGRAALLEQYLGPDHSSDVLVK
mmetsp:Transcript_66801/g.159845  ORF Transcript_66801/g.159845 Transcript_66801/m.159845 type:complete len:282 (+) Transcript_66801:59-904(+)